MGQGRGRPAPPPGEAGDLAGRGDLAGLRRPDASGSAASQQTAASGRPARHLGNRSVTERAASVRAAR